MTSENAGSSPLARKIQHLYDDRSAKVGKRLTDASVADGIAAMAGQLPEFAGANALSKAYLHELRTGKKINPSVTVIALLARYFEVRPGYFFDDAPVDPALELLTVKARGLSPAGLQAVLDMIGHVRQLEQFSQPERRDG